MQYGILIYSMSRSASPYRAMTRLAMARYSVGAAAQITVSADNC
jgi:hypothetical protein